MVKKENKEIVQQRQILTTFKNGQPLPIYNLRKKQLFYFLGSITTMLITLAILIYIILVLTGKLQNDFIWKFIK